MAVCCVCVLAVFTVLNGVDAATFRRQAAAKQDKAKDAVRKEAAAKEKTDKAKADAKKKPQPVKKKGGVTVTDLKVSTHPRTQPPATATQEGLYSPWPCPTIRRQSSDPPPVDVGHPSCDRTWRPLLPHSPHSPSHRSRVPAS